MKNNKYNSEIHNRRSIRLKGYDYSKPGFYFVTICIDDGNCYFGNVIDKKMQLSQIGEITKKCWLNIPKHYPNVNLDEYVIMPNHLHGIIEVVAGTKNVVGAQNLVPLQACPMSQNKFGKIVPKSLGCIIRGFKIGVTKWCRKNNHEYFKWQRNFYDHIIRDKYDLIRIKKYIINNPADWERDRNNLEGLFM